MVVDTYIGEIKGYFAVGWHETVVQVFFAFLEYDYLLVLPLIGKVCQRALQIDQFCQKRYAAQPEMPMALLGMLCTTALSETDVEFMLGLMANMP